MDDQALVEGSVVFKDEDDPGEESQLAEQAWWLGSCRPTTELPSCYLCLPWLRTGTSSLILESVQWLDEPALLPASTGHSRGCCAAPSSTLDHNDYVLAGQVIKAACHRQSKSQAFSLLQTWAL